WEELNLTYPQAEISKRTTGRVIKTLIEVLKKELRKGNSVVIQKFGTFIAVKRKFATPQGMKGISATVVFKPSKHLKRASYVKTSMAEE
ncbi:MAG: hypothetical protein DSZ30_00855, partial [Aquificaceae bacterium]